MSNFTWTSLNAMPPAASPAESASPPPLTTAAPAATQVCTDAEVLRATFPSFALPSDGSHVSLLLYVPRLDCGVPQQGVLLSLGSGGTPAVDVAVDCGPQHAALLLTSAELGSAAYQLPAGSTGAGASLALVLTQDRPGAFAACADGQELAALPGSSAALLQHLADSALLGPAVVFGARGDAERSARADIEAAYVSNAPVPCNRTQPGTPLQGLLQDLAAAAAITAALPPLTVTVDQQPTAVAVGQQLRLAVTAAGAVGDARRIRVTLFGLAPEGCAAAECGDRVVETLAPQGQPASLAVAAAYPRAGRYVVRVEVSLGGVGQ